MTGPLTLSNSNSSNLSRVTLEAYVPDWCKDGCTTKRPIIIAPSSGTALTFSSGTGYNIKNLSLQGNSTANVGVATTSGTSNITFERMTVNGFLTAGYTCVNTNGVKWLTSLFSNNTEGANANCSNIVFDNNVFDNNASAYCTANPGSCATKHALALSGPFSTGTGAIARNNRIVRTGEISGRCSTVPLNVNGRYLTLEVENNEITSTNATTACPGIALGGEFAQGSGQEGFTTANIRGNNVVNPGGSGISVSSCNGCFIENNQIVRNANNGAQAKTDDFIGIKAPGAAEGTGDMFNNALRVRNNSVYLEHATANSTAIKISTIGTGYVVSSNLIKMEANANAATQCFDTTGLSQSAFTAFDYNLCNRTGGTAKWSQTFASITAARAAATPWDVHGTATDPRIVAAPTDSNRNSLAVISTSAAVNAGDPSWGTRIAYKGQPKIGVRDIGAVEFSGIGKTYYVATNGSNSNDGLTLSTPFQTIAAATSIVNPGDTIEIRAGTYNQSGSLVISRAGTANAPITIKGYNGERPLIRGGGIGPSVYFYTQSCEDAVTNGESGNVDCANMYWNVTGLEIRGSLAGQDDGNAIKIDTPNVKVQGNVLCCSKADVVKLVRTANNIEILDNEIYQDSLVITPGGNAQGVDIVGANNPHVAGNYVHNMTDLGMYCKGNCRNPLFENNLLMNIGSPSNGHAIMIGQNTDAELLLDGDYEAYDGIVRNNVVVNSTWACIAVSSAFNTKVYNNSCYNTGQNVHGSLFFSNESEIQTGNNGAEVYNNIFFGSSNTPIIKMTADAFDNFGTLTIANNIYFATGGAAPTFQANNDFAPTNFATYLTAYNDLTGKTDNSTVVDPKYERTSGRNALTLLPTSPAINYGAPNTVATKDFRWISRPQNGSKVDIGAYEFTGVVQGDTTKPTVISSSPAAGATNVPIGVSVTITFSEPIDCDTITTASLFITGVSGSVSCFGSTASVTPAVALNYGAVYSVNVTTAVSDIIGNTLASPFSSAFTTVPAPATGDQFSFLVYGDNRSNNTCSGNTVHLGLLDLMVAETNIGLVLHVGDMIAGLYNTTNWVNNGPCTASNQIGAFGTQIAPLKNRTPSTGLTQYFYPSLGNHDDGWGSGWYPDKFGDGWCTLFDPQQLGIVNHTRHAEYFLDQTNRVPHYTDAEFYNLACSTSSPAVYSSLMYYNFKYKNTVFIMMRLNDDYYDLMECGTCDGAFDNYDHYFYKHQLDWLRYTLNQAQADGTVQNIFVFMHTPLFTTADSHGANATWQVLSKDFSARSKVKAVFSGHDHVYERTYPIRVDTGNPNGVRDDANGVVYYTTGGGGSPLDGVNARPQPLMNFSQAVYHYMRVDVDGNTVTTKAKNASGVVIDTFTR